MKKTNVTIYVCDACGKPSLAGEGYDPIEEASFESRPAGWFGGFGNSSTVDFCPECYAKLTGKKEKVTRRRKVDKATEEVSA